MKIEFIKRGAATRLILIFAGWSTDARYYNDCQFDGWDTAVVSDYRHFTMPSIPDRYTTVYLFAYSLGVAAASFCGISAAVKVAICGTPHPVSDDYGIPEAVYAGTLNGLNERNLMKFHLRMAGDKSTFDFIKTKLPQHPDIAALKEELSSIRICSQGRDEALSRDARLVRPNAPDCVKFDRIYISEDDRIFPKESLTAYWEGRGYTEIVNLKSSHAVDIASIIRRCLPDTTAIGEGFQRAGKSYNENAVVQREICRKIAERLDQRLPLEKREGISLLEIGPGQGLLTEEWSKLLRPKSATYVDLAEMPGFGIAVDETYLQTDAEQWLEETEEKFDIILSASTIQWFADPIRFLSTVRQHLNPGGIAILSTFVKGNLHELDSLRPSPILYRTAEEYAAAPVEILDEWKASMKFESVRDMKMHLRLTGVSPKNEKSFSPVNSLRPGKLHSPLPLELTFCPQILLVESDSSDPKKIPSPTCDKWFDDPENLASIDRGISQMKAGMGKAYSMDEIRN